MTELDAVVSEIARRVVRDELERLAPQWEWLTIAEAAERLGVTAKAINSKIDRGVLTKHKFDGHRYVSGRELDALIRGGKG